MYDAWAAYDSKAIGTQFGDRLRRPKRDRTLANKRIAVSYAGYRASVDLFPKTQKAVLDPFMTDKLGYDPTDQSRDTLRPVGIGNVACDAVLSARHWDGSNQLGDLTRDAIAYADYTQYAPVNPPGALHETSETVRDPDRFQPLIYGEEAMRSLRDLLSGPFLGAQWYMVIPFSGPYDREIHSIQSKFPPVKFGTEAFANQVLQLVRISESLTDEQKMTSEYWNDGPHSELPAGHWCLFAQFISARDRHTLDDDVKLFFALTNAVSDTGVVVWRIKRNFDSVRPVTAIPYQLKGKRINSWGGPGQGTISIDGSLWLPYQSISFPTPPFPEYPSGHSGFSAAAATILRLWTEADKFGDSVTFAAGSSIIEPGITPRHNVTLYWQSFTDAANQAGMSRRFGGLHFETGDLAGRAVGRLVADRVWKLCKRHFWR